MKMCPPPLAARPAYPDSEPLAHFAGRLATGLRDVTSDLTALDSTGFWAVVGTYEGDWTLARFDDVRDSPAPLAEHLLDRPRPRRLDLLDGPGRIRRRRQSHPRRDRRRRGLPGEPLPRPVRADRSAGRTPRPRRAPAHREPRSVRRRGGPPRHPRRDRFSRALPTPRRPHRHLGTHQGHRTDRAGIPPEGHRREHHDRRPGPQRPGPGRRDRHRRSPLAPARRSRTRASCTWSRP